jgi:cation transport regulator ChaC
MLRKYYFAYGSNMDWEQMSKRCPEAEFVSVGTISGWRFQINTRGVATIIPESGSTVYGIVWCLSEADERSLDSYEGVRNGLYTKRTMEVRLSDGQSVKAFAYVAKDSQPGTARPGYMRIILSAARSNAFPSSYIQELQRWCTTDE